MPCNIGLKHRGDEGGRIRKVAGLEALMRGAVGFQALQSC